MIALKKSFSRHSTVSDNRRVSSSMVKNVGIFFLGITCLASLVLCAVKSSVDDEVFPPRIYYDWANREPGVALKDPKRWKAAQPFVFKLKSNYLMMWYDNPTGRFRFALNPADNENPALTVGDIEALLDHEFIRKVNKKIYELYASRHFQSPDERNVPIKYPLPDKYRLDNICLLEKYKNLCVNATGEARVRVWQVPLTKSGYLQIPGEKERSTLRIVAMYDPDVGETVFNTFPGKFTLREWRALTRNESIAEILDFYETIE